jgi:hypothetical protein
MDIDWNTMLADQLDWHWRTQLRPRLDGLTDDEYFWEPVAGCWSIRPRGEAAVPAPGGSGEYTADFAFPAPDPPPVTTIAWRLAHIIVGVFGARNAGHFGGPPVDYQTFAYAGSAAQALAQLDDACAVSVTRAWPGRAVRPRAPTPSTRWPSLCCTSAARPSTTARRSPCCATSTGIGPDQARIIRRSASRCGQSPEHPH